MSVKVFTAQEALKAVNDDSSKVLVAEKKKDDKTYKGTRFLNAYYNIGTDAKKEGWFSIENVELSNGVADPNNKEDKRNEYEGTRLQLETTVSKAGDFGEFLLKLNPEWKKLVTQLSEAGTINMKDRKIHGLVQSTLSDENKTNPGGVLEDPIVRFKIDFDAFPQKYKHKFLVGQPRTQFFDYRTRYVDENGREQFKAATVVNDNGEEELVTDKNMHLFITRGSIIRRGRIMMPSIAVSQSWCSHPIVMNRCVLEPGSEDGFSDDAPIANVNVAAALTQVVTPSPPVVTPSPALVAPSPALVEETQSAEVDDIANALAGI